MQAPHFTHLLVSMLWGLRNCPADAIMGSVRNPHSIDTNKCVKWGACMDTCRVGGISNG